MRWRGLMCWMMGVGVGALAGCFEVPPLPDAPACQSNDDCSDQVFCNGVEACEDGVCVAGEGCDGDCVELGGGEGMCGATGEPEPAPEPEGKEPEPTPGPTPEPPPPDPDCLEDGGKCRLENGGVGTCNAGECVTVGCDEADTCPVPGCATCERGVCGLVQGCASVALSCVGSPRYAARIICGAAIVEVDCAGSPSPEAVGCRADARAKVCCGAIDERCEDASLVSAEVQVRISPNTGWACAEPAQGSVTCEAAELSPQSEISVNCEVTSPLPGKR